MSLFIVLVLSIVNTTAIALTIFLVAVYISFLQLRILVLCFIPIVCRAWRLESVDFIGRQAQGICMQCGRRQSPNNLRILDVYLNPKPCLCNTLSTSAVLCHRLKSWKGGPRLSSRRSE